MRARGRPRRKRRFPDPERSAAQSEGDFAMKYCRFSLANQIHYGAVEERKGELWITGPAPAPEEDLRFRLAVEQAAAGEL